MKRILSNITAVALVVWYSLSVIGFDVHTCSDSGESYVATILSGTSCDDIHPEHDEKGCTCCHHGQTAHNETEQDAASLDTKPCCSDDWQMIVLTGFPSEDEHEHFDECHCGHCPCIADCLSTALGHDSGSYGRKTFYRPGSGNRIPFDFQQTYSIWRI